MRIEDLETPVPVVDLDIVEANLRRMQDYCDRQGLALRPHIKTHKIPALAKRQIELGAQGITCQKLGEAEVMADAGIDDILISYPLVGPAKAERLGVLAGRVRMRVAIDNPVALATAAAAAKGGREIGLLIEFDAGNGRTGVGTVEEVLDLARAIRATDGLRFDGVMNYPVTPATGAFLDALLPRLESQGLKPAVISGGGSPHAFRTHEMAPAVTELRVGTYIYSDRMMVAAGNGTHADCALAVHATVVSRPTPDRAILDGGTKTFTSDPMPGAPGQGHGFFPDYPDAKLERMSEEHGMVDLSACAKKPEVGERVRVIPNHVCVVCNLHDRIAVTRGGRFEGFWDVAARGRTL